MRNFAKIAAIVGVASAIATCIEFITLINYQVIPSYGVPNLSVHEIDLPASSTILQITGTVMASLGNVSNIRSATIGSSSLVNVYLSVWWPKSTSTMFRYELTVPNTVNQVFFGTDRRLIWHRAH